MHNLGLCGSKHKECEDCGFVLTTEVIPALGATLAAPVISTTSLSGGKVDKAYSKALAATGEGLVWTVSAGSLPNGLTLSSDGTITGTPTKAGTYTFTVKAENGAGNDTQVLTIKIEKKSSGGLCGNIGADGIFYGGMFVLISAGMGLLLLSTKRKKKETC